MRRFIQNSHIHKQVASPLQSGTHQPQSASQSLLCVCETAGACSLTSSLNHVHVNLLKWDGLWFICAFSARHAVWCAWV